ncbi:hypothetical protein [Burkholderia sp. LA-2-3-30-S1-D2]|uniref:hypothetical protein n=1 Tax=Burkholderia sp. LA-2-3-30-S1-D2 TaxID=1637862 RepID=UPI00131F1BC1|nr:hypothetical protein [Burkholderia sp. LA-2-3-30-S1-D2]
MDSCKQLVAVISSDFDDDSASSFQAFIESLHNQQWHHGAPLFFDEVDEEGCYRPEDIPVRSVGCVLNFPANDERDRSVEQASYADVSSLIGLLERYSQDHVLEFEVELDGTYVGTIEDGKANRTLAVGLMEAWRTSI